MFRRGRISATERSEWRPQLEAGARGRIATKRGIGEPISAARAADELVECQRHESLLNLAFPSAPLWLLCPYDVETLPPDVLDEAGGATRS